MPTKAQLSAALADIIADSAIFHDIVHGASSDPDVITEGGSVPTVAKVLSDIQNEIIQIGKFKGTLTGTQTFSFDAADLGFSGYGSTGNNDELWEIVVATSYANGAFFCSKWNAVAVPRSDGSLFKCEVFPIPEYEYNDENSRMTLNSISFNDATDKIDINATCSSETIQFSYLVKKLNYIG